MAKKVHMSYEDFRAALKGRRLPACMVNIDALDENLRVFFEGVGGTGKTIRVATKSVRCPWVLDHIKSLDKDGLLKGYMCFTPEEADFLYSQGYDDFLVAYPSLQNSDLDIMTRMTRDGADVKFVVDSEEHLDIIGDAGAKADTTVKVIVELDVALEKLSGKLYFGVRRSPVRRGRDVVRLVRYAEKKGGVKVVGVMAYEAQVAGLNDHSPYTRVMNPLKRWIKKASIPEVLEQRAEVWRTVEREGIEFELVNGGGSGSIYTTSADPAVTEATIGSGLYTSHLFRYYKHIPWAPSAFFAIQAVRKPKPGMITCQGGGYIASGAAGYDRLPMPYSPEGLKMLGFEGAGEVQTPLLVPPNCPEIKLGDPIIWQHAKAGEVMERFNEVLVISEGKVIDNVPTYRGLGKSFL